MLSFWSYAQEAQEGNVIINQVVKNKKTSDITTILNDFSYTTYEKILVTANPEEVKVRFDSVFEYKKKQKIFKNIDSTSYKFKRWIENQHLYQTEKISHFQFAKKRLKETVVASKMAGFKTPIYEVLGYEILSKSIYENHLKILDFLFVNPLSKRGLSLYEFTKTGETTIENRSCSSIKFTTQKNNQNILLEGVYFVDNQTFGIAKAVFKINGIVNITTTYEFVFLEDKNCWFPKQNFMKLEKGFHPEAINIFGENITFPLLSFDKNQPTDYTYITYSSKNSDISYNQNQTLKHKNIAIETCALEQKPNEQIWNTYKKDTLDYREQCTHIALDSLVEQEKIEQKIVFGKKIINGFVPLSFFDFDLRYLLKYNNYEGFRIGIGGSTNSKLSSKYKIFGYTAYGLKDDVLKYSIGNALRIHRFSNTWLGISYTNDLSELANMQYLIDKKSFKIYDPRPLNLNTFYNHQTYNLFLETKLLPKTESILQFSQSYIQPLFQYSFLNNNIFYQNYTLSTASVSVKWTPFSQVMQTPIGRLEYEKNYPRFTFQVQQTLPNFMKNDFIFFKIDAKFDYEKKFLNKQKLTLFAQVGQIFGNVPLTHTYSVSPNSLTRSDIVKRITFQGKNSFETMFFNEFFSTRFAMLQAKYSFDRFKISKKIKPSITLVNRWAIGDFKDKDKHFGLLFSTIEKGYFETGIEAAKIFKGFGLAGFFRYGYYQKPNVNDNISIKLSYTFDLGL